MHLFQFIYNYLFIYNHYSTGHANFLWTPRHFYWTPRLLRSPFFGFGFSLFNTISLLFYTSIQCHPTPPNLMICWFAPSSPRPGHLLDYLPKPLFWWYPHWTAEIEMLSQFLPSSTKGGAAVMLLSVLSLLLSPLVSASSAADYYVHSLPGAPKGPFLKMHAG